MADEMKAYINKDMRMGEIIRAYPSAAYALMGCGMGCVSCPSAAGETLAEAAMVHGLDADEVCAFVNDWISDKKAAAQ